MTNPTLESQLLNEVQQLSPPLQRKVVEFAHSLVQTRPSGTPGRQLLGFAGILNAEEARAMMGAIEGDCERIDPDGW